MSEDQTLMTQDEPIEKLKPYYVYALIDKTNNENKVFYIGKGTDERCDQHLKEALSGEENTSEKIEKIQRLKEINAFDRIIISRHDSEKEALAVEAVLIKWAYGLNDLTNQVNGHRSEYVREKGDYSNNIARLDVVKKTGLHTGAFKEDKISDLKEFGAYEYRAQLFNNFKDKGYSLHETNGEYKKFDPIESNGYIGFVLSLPTLEFVIYFSKTRIPLIYCINTKEVDEEMKDKLARDGLALTELKNNGTWRRIMKNGEIIKFKGEDDLIAFIENLNSILSKQAAA